MDLLFIDANIYLRFFDGNQPEYKKLLKTLVEAKDCIFITEQLVNEVNRNKLSVFKSSCDDNLTDEVVKNRHLPAHFDVNGKEIIKEWNNKREELRKTSQNLIKEQTTIFHELLSTISASTDVVSKELETIFSMAKSPSDEQLKRAIGRKRIGNPPGKSQDPLGDQLSWEQFLESVSKSDNVWIISNDTDYFSIYKEKCYLNPVLYSEVIKSAKKEIKVNCFDRLSIGLKDFNEHIAKKLVSLPKEKELDEISKMELLPSLTGFTSSSMGTMPTYSGIQSYQQFSLREGECPNCHVVTATSPIIRNVGTSAFEFIYVCHNCGKQWNKITSNE